MADKYDKGPISELQWKILIHVCKNNGATYKSICRETGKCRTTIIQSIQPLIKRRCIDKVKVDPILIKSKLIFMPTYKGKSHAEAWGLGVEEIFRTETDHHILNYLQILKQISDVSQRRIMLQELASSLLNTLIIDAHGNISTSDKITSIKEAFYDGLISLQDAGYNTSGLFNDKTIQWFTEFFSAIEVKELEKSFSKSG